MTDDAWAPPAAFGARVVAGSRPARGRGPVAAAVLAGAIATAWLLFSVLRLTSADAAGPSFVKAYASPRNRWEIALVHGDGQFYAAIAMDPTLARPGALAVDDPAGELVYRAQRPVFPYAAWILSLGRPAELPYAMGAIVVAGAALAGWSAASLLARRGGLPLLGAGVALLPGAYWSLAGLTPELLGFGLAGAGLVVLDHDDADRTGTSHRVLAAALLVAAALTRETMVLVAIGLGAWAFAARRRDLLWVAVAPVLALAVWTVAVAFRVGTLSAHGSERFSAVPFRGAFDGLRDTSDPAVVVLSALLLVILVAAAIRVAPRDRIAWAATAFVLLVPFFGYEAWSTSDTMPRTLLAPVALAAVVLVSWVQRPRTVVPA